MKNHIDFPCLMQNTPPEIFLEHFLQRLYSMMPLLTGRYDRMIVFSTIVSRLLCRDLADHLWQSVERHSQRIFKQFND